MKHPFGEDMTGEPVERMYAELNCTVVEMIGSLRVLAETIGAGPVGSLAATATCLESARVAREVAVLALMTGVDVILREHLQASAPVGASLIAQVDAVQSAWEAFGTTGRWERPGRVDPPAVYTPEMTITTNPPRPLSDGECLTIDAADEWLATIVGMAIDFNGTGQKVFSDLATHELPCDDLMDALDTAVVDHMKVSAALNKTMAENLYRLVEAARASVDGYQETSLWSAPTAVPDDS